MAGVQKILPHQNSVCFFFLLYQADCNLCLPTSTELGELYKLICHVITSVLHNFSFLWSTCSLCSSLKIRVWDNSPQIWTVTGIWFHDPSGTYGREDEPSSRMVQCLQQGPGDTVITWCWWPQCTWCETGLLHGHRCQDREPSKGLNCSWRWWRPVSWCCMVIFNWLSLYASLDWVSWQTYSETICTLYAVILSNKNIYLTYAHTDNPFRLNASFQWGALWRSG